MEAVNGVKKTLSYNRTLLCRMCSGTGGYDTQCSTCKRRGFVLIRKGKGTYSVGCSSCNGTGMTKLNTCEYSLTS